MMERGKMRGRHEGKQRARRSREREQVKGRGLNREQARQGMISTEDKTRKCQMRKFIKSNTVADHDV
ncbi:hypothetical protein Pmani_021382 [Petrolisthes manimaculis]|uniref:Uncharacterized protein n=1 Tax=Petrolisthes manimaculis TaxID=1843537 RepID=A0AAE1PEX8_9EUCA|nr:hypothetical protein Pmani_021382 [Petrolisthes manimaculis]